MKHTIAATFRLTLALGFLVLGTIGNVRLSGTDTAPFIVELTFWLYMAAGSFFAILAYRSFKRIEVSE